MNNMLFSKHPDPNSPGFAKFSQDLLKCHIKAERGKRETVNNMLYESWDLANTMRLAENVHNRVYRPSRGIAFVIKHPVTREIFAAPFPDRVIHHYIYDKTIDFWESRFIPTSYSCLKGRGTLKAVETTYEQMKELSNDFKDADDIWYAKLDIQGYFMSLRRRSLLAAALKGLDEQYPKRSGYEYDTLRFLWRQIIMDDPVRGVRLRNYPQDWANLPKSKSLLYQPPGVGIVIGNLTSQLLSNIYLNQMDWFITDTLGWKYYGRYVDDFVIFFRKEQLPQIKRDIKVIENFLMELGLTLHPKKRQIQPIAHGVKFLGATIRPWHIYPGDRIEKNARKAARAYAKGYGDGESVISYLGHIQHLDCERLMNQILDIIIPDLGPAAQAKLESGKPLKPTDLPEYIQLSLFDLFDQL